MSGLVPAPPDEIAALPISQARAVLGVVPRLVHLRGAGVIRAPADDRCVAGELLAEEAVGPTWRMNEGADLRGVGFLVLVVVRSGASRSELGAHQVDHHGRANLRSTTTFLARDIKRDANCG